MSLTDAALQQRLDEVYSGPTGPRIGAFFDFDGTLIHGFSAVDFYLDRIRELTEENGNVTFHPVLSHANDDGTWSGERGFVHEVVKAKLNELGIAGEGDVYACGPPPMIDALSPVLFMQDFDPDRIYFDRFTPSTGSSAH